MRPGILLPLLVVALSLPAGALAATTRCSGLQCSSLGSSSVSTSPDGRSLHVSLAGDTHDGFTVATPNLEGCMMRSTSAFAATTTAQTVDFTFSTTAIGITGTATVLCALERSSSSTVVTVDLSSMCTSGSCPTARQYLYFHNSLVATVDVPLLSSFVLQGGGAVSHIPSVSLEFSNTNRVLVHTMSLSSSSLYLFGGLSRDVDLVVTVLDRSSSVTDPSVRECVSSCTVTCPATGGMSSLDFSSLSVVSGGSMLTAADMNLDGLPDALSMSPSSSLSSVTTTASWSRMVYGGGGGGGCGGSLCAPSSLLDESSPPSSLDFSLRRIFNWTGIFDETADFTTRVQARDQFGNPRVASSLECRMQGGQVLVSSSIGGSPADSVRVLSRGTEVGRYALSSGAPLQSSVTVSAPPGGVSSFAFASCGASHGGWDLATNKKLITDAGTAPPDFSTSSVTCPDLGMHVTFADARAFVVDALPPVIGDELQFKSSCSSSSGEVLTINGTNFSYQRSGSPSPGASVLEVTGVSSSHSDQVVAHVVGPSSLSSTQSTVDVALDLDRVDTTPARGASVTVLLSSNLVLVGDSEYDLFSHHGQTQHFTTLDGNNLYTLDVAILGPGCGPASGGRMFTLQVARAPGAPDGLGFVTVTHTELASCPGPPLPCNAGSRAVVLLDASTPASAVTITAHQLKTGNDADGTTKIVLDYQVVDPTSDAVELYRAPYGDYPLYASGSTAALPTSYPPAAPWTPVSLQCSSGAAGTVSVCADEPSSRDCYTFSIVVIDRAGNRSPFISTPQCVLDYHLGDNSNGVAVCSGDNQVTTSDISALGSRYGAQVPPGSTFACLDDGPTLDRTVDSRPVPDHRLSFADLILAAINFSLVSMPQDTPRPLAATANEVSLELPKLPAVGQTFDAVLRMRGAGDVQGLSATLAFDPAVVEQVRVADGELLGRQGRESVVLSSGPGVVDAVLLGAGGGLAGEGELARVTFRVKTAGEPALALGSIVGRDVQNRDVAIMGGAPGAGGGRTALRLAFPNPFERSTTVVFSLHETGPADVGVFDVAGRHVRTLMRGVQPAGEHLLSWDGRDDAGNRLGAGVYLLRLDAGGHQETRALRLVK